MAAQRRGVVEHDENGNRLGRDAGGGWTEQAYRYDPEDRLERITVGPDTPGSPAVEFDYDYSGRRTRERRGTVQANDSVAAQESTNYYSDVFEVRGDRARKYYIAGGLLVASRDVPAPATLQVASAGGGAVQVATVWQAGSPTVAFTLSGSALSAAVAVLASGGVIWLLLPGRRRRLGLGLRLRTADVVLVAVVSLSSAAPWPFLVQPAYAEKTGPTPTPTAVPPAEVHHYHLDHLGSPQTVTDGYGTIVEQVRYDPYGAVRNRWKPIGGVYNTTGLTEQDRREFTGYQTEPLSELNYANARFYDPDFATFLTHDPAREFASPYTYTGWNPINLTDPSGACVWDLCLGEILTAVAIGAGVGFAANAIQAAVNGASIGEVFKAGAIGGAIGGAGAGFGFVAGIKLNIALANALGAANSQSVMEGLATAMYVGGAGQAAYSLWQGDYRGLIGMGLSIGLGFALDRSANGSSGAQFAADASSVSDASNDIRGSYVFDEILVEANRLDALGQPWIDEMAILGAIGGLAARLSTRLITGAVRVGGPIFVARSAASAGRAMNVADGFVQAEGSIVKFSVYYYNRLWATGRGAPFLQAEEVLQTATNITQHRLPGFYRYTNDKLEMVFNPTTGEVWHLQPLPR